MPCNTCVNSAWNILRLRGHLLQGPPDYISKIIYYTVCSQQVSSKRNRCASCYSNLPVKSTNIPEQSLLPVCLGPRHVCVSCDIPKALVPLETPNKTQVKLIEWNLPYLIKYLRNMFATYWTAAKRRVNKSNKSKPQPEPRKSTQRRVHEFHRIDMEPARPKKKEKPLPPEIPEPGVPGENLPGFPIPGFPDVAIPIVPELPMPDMPEIPLPMPQDPGKPKPKGIPLPGDPVPILQDMLRQRWPLPILQDLIRRRFPVPAFQDASITFCSPSIHSPLECNKFVVNIMKSNIHRLSLPRKDVNRKIEIPKGLIVPPLLKDLLKNNKVILPRNEIVSTLSKLTLSEIEAIFHFIKIHRQILEETEEKASEFILGMPCKQFEELLHFISMLKKQENHSKLLVNKLNVPSELFIKNSKFLVPKEDFKGIFTGKIEIKDRKYLKRF